MAEHDDVDTLIDGLWDYSDPAGSETRIRESMTTGDAHTRLALRTQIARTFSLRGQFDDAHRELAHVASALGGQAEPGVRVRMLLERGRALRSAGFADASRPVFEDAYARAQDAGLTLLAIDAAHMLGMVASREHHSDGSTAAQRWNEKALELAEGSDLPRAIRWRGSLHNNLGCEAREENRLREALLHFEAAQDVFVAHGNDEQQRVARWQVGNTLRLMGHRDEALAVFQELKHDCDEAGIVDSHVDEELEALTHH